MKKIIAIALALVLTCALAVTCFAALETPKTGDVTATYKAPDAAGIVYKVDVAFTAMSFTYTPEGNGTWDTTEHEYVEKAAAKWEGTGTITVTNHSNAAFNVAISYEAAEGFEAATANFSKTNFTLDSAATNNEATTDNATLTMGGSLPASATTATTIGTVTVALQ